MSYSISVVQLCPAASKDQANALAENLGYGPDNLSVELQDAQGNRWYGCHAWWQPEALAQLAGVPAELGVISSVREGGEPQTHWQGILDEHNLDIMTPEMSHV